MAKHKLPVSSPKPVPVKIVSEPVNETKSHEAQEKKWRAEDDLRTMKSYAELQRDKERMKAAKSLAKQQMKDLAKCMK